MFSLLLAMIYLAFISLGLPDALLGAAWPVLYKNLNVPLSFAGIITFIISCGTVVSSLMSDRMTRWLGAGKVTAFSVLLTAVALFGFSISGSFWMLCLWAIPYGLGAGAVDAALNNYVALHYSSRHMNWLHCFWGVGVTISPYIMSVCLQRNLGWQSGYRTVSIIQIVLTLCLFLSLPLWKKRNRENADSPENTAPLGLTGALRIPGVKHILAAFCCYCSLESVAIVWSCSYLALARGFSPAEAAKWGALFFFGIMAGRFISGFISPRIGDRNMIRYGSILLLIGLLLLLLPLKFSLLPLAGLLLFGTGCAPIYPAIIHQTPSNFGERNSQAIIGIQMASAYVGSTTMPPLFGLLAERTGMHIFPWFILFFLILMTLIIERLNSLMKQKVQNA